MWKKSAGNRAKLNTKTTSEADNKG